MAQLRTDLARIYFVLVLTGASATALGYLLGRNHSLTPLGRAESGYDRQDGDAPKVGTVERTAEEQKLLREEDRAATLAEGARKGEWNEDLILEQLSRNLAFLTSSGLQKLRSAFVVVVGCGGVGSHAAAALARSGVGRIRLVDFDNVSLSTLNRHSVATLADVGTSKVSCLKKRLGQIVPWVQFDLRNQLFAHDSADSLLEPWHVTDGVQRIYGEVPTYIVDAIDNIDTKVMLLQYCHRHQLRVISAMGAGCKSDPTRILIGDLSTSTEDPLSKAVRVRLRKLGIDHGFPCVFSTEKMGTGKAALLPLNEAELAQGSINELSALPDFRVRILPVLGTMPTVFGCTAANHILLDIAGYPHDYLPFKNKTKMWDGILSKLQAVEERIAKHAHGSSTEGVKVRMSVSDVGYLVEEVYKGRSVVSGQTTKLALIRWEHCGQGYLLQGSLGAKERVSNLELNGAVLMTMAEATSHLERVLIGGAMPGDVYAPSVLDRVVHGQASEAQWACIR